MELLHSLSSSELYKNDVIIRTDSIYMYPVYLHGGCR